MIRSILILLLLVSTSTRSIPAVTKFQNENFDQFFKRFKSDSVFQISRVRFPFVYEYWELGEDEPRRELIDKKDWRHVALYYEDGYGTREIDAYTQNINKQKDSVKIELRGVDNGINIDYEFVLEAGVWILISKKDYSS